MDLYSSSGACRKAAAFAVALIVLASGLAGPAEAIRRETLKLHTARGEQVINTEITETQEEKALGLMFRTSLADNAASERHGMEHHGVLGAVRRHDRQHLTLGEPRGHQPAGEAADGGIELGIGHRLP